MRPVLGLERSQSPHVTENRHSRAWLGCETQAWASSPHSAWPASLSVERREALEALSEARERILKHAHWLLLRRRIEGHPWRQEAQDKPYLTSYVLSGAHI